MAQGTDDSYYQDIIFPTSSMTAPFAKLVLPDEAHKKSPADRAWKGGYVQWKSGSIRATRVSIFPERMSSFMADTSTRSS